MTILTERSTIHPLRPQKKVDKPHCGIIYFLCLSMTVNIEPR